MMKAKRTHRQRECYIRTMTARLVVSFKGLGDEKN
jgi:hypothetical protein